MKSQEILEWLNDEIEDYPERATGNECESYVMGLIGRLLATDRQELIKALREWIHLRGKRTVLAVQIASEYHLCELKPDLESLLADVKSGKVLAPYYEEFIVPALSNI
jgi:hypothetical protein